MNKKNKLHFDRINAKLKLKKNIFLDIRLIIHELKMQGTFIYSSMVLEPKQEVELLLYDPKKAEEKIIIQCEIVWCEDIGAHSHIVKTEEFRYRSYLSIFLNQKEKEDLKKFIKEKYNLLT